MKPTRYVAWMALSVFLSATSLASAQPGAPIAMRRDRLTDSIVTRDLAHLDSLQQRATTPRASVMIYLARQAYERNDDGRLSLLLLEQAEQRRPAAALRTRRPELWALLDSLAQRPVLSSAMQQGALALEIALVRANAPLLGAPSCDDWDNAAVKLAAQLRALADTVVAAPAAPPAVPMVVPPTAPVSPAELRAVPSRVHFAYDQSQLAPASKRVLDALADSLAQYPAVQVYLEGHTDPRGSVAYNAALSQRRVQAVYAYLRSKGLAASRLNTAALGKSKLESTSAAVRDLARNRRVTMRFVAPDGREIPTVVQLDDLQVEPRAPR